SAIVELLISHDVISDLLVVQNDRLNGRAKPLRQVSGKIQSFAAQPSAMGVACFTAQLGGVLRLAGTDDCDVVTARPLTISLAIESDAKPIAEQIERGGHDDAAFDSASAAPLWLSNEPMS